MGFSRVRFWLSRYSKRDRKNFKLAVFGVRVLAFLVEKRVGCGVLSVTVLSFLIKLIQVGL